MTYAEEQVNNQLDAFLKRFERLDEEKKNVQDAIKDLKAEVKAAGFDIKIFNAVYKLMQMDEGDRQNQDYLMDTYRKAAGIAAK